MSTTAILKVGDLATINNHRGAGPRVGLIVYKYPEWDVRNELHLCRILVDDRVFVVYCSDLEKVVNEDVL